MNSHLLHSGPHTRAPLGVSALMGKVMLALLPATLFGIALYGWPALWLLLVTALAAVAFEAVCLGWAGKPLRRHLLDGSALLSGWLLALTLPPWAPWWIGVSGAFLAIVVGKQVFGGIGQNPFNPAMVARVALLVSFPVEMTTWITPVVLGTSGAPDLLQSLAITFDGAIPDGHTGASLIGHVKTELAQQHTVPEALQSISHPLLKAFLGDVRGSLGETSTLMVLGGGLWLLGARVITWHIPLSLLLTLGLLAAVSHALNADRFPGPLFHLCTGGAMFCAFFIATDYVTSPNTPLGQILFGCGIGLLIFVIRSFGGYPEGVGFAVLLMNAATPLIDHYLRPRIYGRDWRGRPLPVPTDRSPR